MELLNKIKDRSAAVNIVGLGYVGLPLALEAAKAGYHVTGIDLSARKVEMLAANQSYVDDISCEEIAERRKDGTFRAVGDFSPIGRESDIVKRHGKLTR